MEDVKHEALRFLSELGKELHRQDNRATNQPMFVVLDRPSHGGTENMPPLFVDAFFTQHAADTYINRHAHNLDAPYVSIESGWRNKGWCMLRELAMSVYLADHPEEEEKL